MRKWQLIIIAALLAVSIFGFGGIEALVSSLLPNRAKIIERTPMYILAYQHVILSILPTMAALIVSLLIGCSLHLSENDELKSLFLAGSSIGETFPSVAIIALSVPLLGYGNLPCMLALFIYAILPILRNTVTGLKEVPHSVTDAAKGMGMGKLKRLLLIELPLARPVILAGFKIALLINISAATLGASVGAGGFGVPIISGIRTNDPMLVLKGTLPVLMMALLADKLTEENSKAV